MALDDEQLEASLRSALVANDTVRVRASRPRRADGRRDDGPAGDADGGPMTLASRSDVIAFLLATHLLFYGPAAHHQN